MVTAAQPKNLKKTPLAEAIAERKDPVRENDQNGSVLSKDENV